MPSIPTAETDAGTIDSSLKLHTWSLTKINVFQECRSIDSVGSHSDISTHTNATMTKTHMEVVCVIDICQSQNLADRKRALDDVQTACIQVGASLSHIQVQIAFVVRE